MAHSYGALIMTKGRTPAEVLDAIVAATRSAVSSLQVTRKQEDHTNWNSVILTSVLTDGTVAEQSLQVNIGDDVVETFIELAQGTVGPEATKGRDAMLYGTLSGDVDWTSVNEIVSYAVHHLAGLPWDQTSGFSMPSQP